MTRAPARRVNTAGRRARRVALAVVLSIAAACGRQTPPPAPTPTPSPGPDREAIRRDSIARVRAAFVAESLSRVYAYRDTAKIRVCAGGDVTLGTNLDTTWTAYASRKLKKPVPALPSPDSLIAPLRPLFGGADVVLLNVEGAIGEGDPPIAKCAKSTSGCYALRMPPRAARAIRRASDRVVVANLANNHARDAGAEGLLETVRRLSDAGVVVTGVDTLPTLVETRHGDTLAILGFATSGPPNDLRDLDAVRRHVTRAVESYRRVIVTMHLGAEGAGAQRTLDSAETYLKTTRGNPVAFADAAAGAGADLVIGHGPHVLRAAEWRGQSLVLYSLGNLLTYGPFSHREPMRRGAVACATVDGRGSVSSARLYPTVQRAPGSVRADRSRRALTLVDSLSKLDFPRSGAKVLKDGRIVRR